MSQERLRRIIDDVARHSAHRSIGTTRSELAARLSEAGIAVPSESWLDALAREAVHGRSYILDTEASETEQEDDPALARALEEAPANLAAEIITGPGAAPSTAGPSEHMRAGQEGTPPPPDVVRRARTSRARTIALIAAGVLVAVSLWRRRARRSRRPRPGGESGSRQP